MDGLSSISKPSPEDKPKTEAVAKTEAMAMATSVPQTSPTAKIENNQICTITVRLIKSFEYRVSRNIILPVDAARTTVGELKETCRKHIASDARFKIFRSIEYNTLKIYTQAFGNKTQNLIINVGDDGFLLDDKATLEFAGVRNETELSFFNHEAYKAYARSPTETKW
ncbi:hypothetical protein GGI10_004220 [Coemansia sp. RSA 2530]|nr:hypothetical protein GGI10_004220 [Coemansia sp. RSA 2530]